MSLEKNVYSHFIFLMLMTDLHYISCIKGPEDLSRLSDSVLLYKREMQPKKCIHYGRIGQQPVTVEDWAHHNVCRLITLHRSTTCYS
jgi:hypothetical protein